jgi:hypothetical protein
MCPILDGYGVRFSFFLALILRELSVLLPGRFTPMKRASGTRWIGGWVDPRAGLDNKEKWKLLTISGLELRPLGRPGRIQSLYWLLKYRENYVIYGTVLCDYGIKRDIGKKVNLSATLI